MKITVAGIGYVGLSNAVLLAQHHVVTAVDVSEQRVQMLNARQNPILDAEISTFLAEKPLNLSATTSSTGYIGADIVIVATPTNYDPATQYFDTSSVDQVVQTVVMCNPNAPNCY